MDPITISMMACAAYIALKNRGNNPPPGNSGMILRK